MAAAYRMVFRVAAAISGLILYDEGYSTPVPVPQYDHFAFWDRGLVPPDKLENLHHHWEDLRSNEAIGLRVFSMI